MEMSSPVFEHEKEIPSLYTCEGRNISPPLYWKGIPPNAKSLALIIDDPDAPDPQAPKMVWDHWILYNIDPDTTGLEENLTPETLPQGTIAGITSWNNHNYGGPCPPIGRHRYYHTLYALDVVLPELASPTSSELKKAMEGHIIATAVYMGTYQKKGTK